jgi:CRP-like cAMP-binding protein
MAGTNQLRELFEKDNNRRHYPKGEIIIMQGNALDCAYLIESGINLENLNTTNMPPIFTVNPK